MNILRVVAEDWEGYYLDGKLLVEGHNVDGLMLLESLKRTVLKDVSIISREVDQKWMEYNGRLPDSSDNIKFAKRGKK